MAEAPKTQFEMPKAYEPGKVDYMDNLRVKLEYKVKSTP